jgi:large subunit ribosomal protein L4
MASLRAMRASKSVPVPHAFRKPFQQTDRRRDDVFLERMMPAVPDTSKALQAWVSSWEEPRVGIMELPSEVWGLPPRPDLVNNVVLWQRALRRLGTATSKGRAEVSGGGRKPRPQKGTGRSRQGSIRSPLWRGGGASHGPRPRDFSYQMNRKQRALGLKTALSDKYRRNALLVLDDPGLELGRTTELLGKLAGLGMSKSHRVMIITTNDYDNQSQAYLQRASRLLTNVHVTVPQRASVFDLVRVSVLIVSVGGLRELHDRLEGLSGGVGKLNLTEWGQAAKARAKPYDLRPGLPSNDAASAQPLLAEAVA